MLQILKPVPPYRKRVYCLVGNEPIEACYDRLQTIIANGGEPFCQALRPLNYLGGPWRMKHGWTETLAKDFVRYADRFVWRKTPIWEYSNRRGERPPFAFLAPRSIHLGV